MTSYFLEGYVTNEYTNDNIISNIESEGVVIGSQQDFLSRLQEVMPKWFGDSNPILNAVLSGLSNTNAFVYSLYSYAKLQLRISTATDGWLDMIAADFFGASLLRKNNQSDASFRIAIAANLFRERATRASVIQVLKAITGRAPLVFEPQRPFDTGAYGKVTGYGLAGAYGSLLMPYQSFVVAFRPLGSGIPNVAGYGISTGAYNTASQAKFADITDIQYTISNNDIYAAIESVKPAGITTWVQIRN
jgi:hypothetical protein